MPVTNRWYDSWTPVVSPILPNQNLGPPDWALATVKRAILMTHEPRKLLHGGPDYFIFGTLKILRDGKDFRKAKA